jgi:hypothetical protein
MTTEATPARAKPTQARYRRVNAEWPDAIPPLTPREAVSAAKRLYRFGMGKAWNGSIKLTSGNRHTWIRYGVFYVNPDQGWHALVHGISHAVHFRLHPRLSGHDWRHAHLERSMVNLVISKGWLDGKLRRPVKPKPPLREVRHQRILTRIKGWEAKRKRADNALRKLVKQKAYYERNGGGE